MITHPHPHLAPPPEQNVTDHASDSRFKASPAHSCPVQRSAPPRRIPSPQPEGQKSGEGGARWGWGILFLALLRDILTIGFRDSLGQPQRVRGPTPPGPRRSDPLGALMAPVAAAVGSAAMVSTAALAASGSIER